MTAPDDAPPAQRGEPARMEAHALTHTGRRPRNEDAHRLSEELGIAVVADGFSGAHGGDYLDVMGQPPNGGYRVRGADFGKWAFDSISMANLGVLADSDITRVRRSGSHTLAPLRPGGSWLALKALPIALALPGLLRRRLYTYRWTSLLVWLYFTEGVVRATSDRGPSVPLAVLEVALSLALFIACALHVRLRLKKPRPAEPT